MIIRTRRWPPLAAALAALLAALALGATGAPLHGIAARLPWDMLGITLTGGAGLLAWHLARLTAAPVPRAGIAGAALPGALIPCIALPAIGTFAVLVPALLATLSARPGQRRVPLVLLVQWSALAALSGDGMAASLGLALAAGLSLREPVAPHANDNPCTEQPLSFWLLPAPPSYATANSRGFAYRVVGRVE